MSDIQTYIEKLKIKKAVVGGFDPEAVYTALQELSSLYEKEIARLGGENERLEAERKAAAGRLAEAETEILGLRARPAEVPKDQSQYDYKLDALAQAVDALNASRDGVIEDAKRTAQEIVAEANRKLEAIRKECLRQKQQRDLYAAKVTEMRQQFGISIKGLRSTLAGMLSDIDALQKEGGERAESPSSGPASPDDEANRLIRLLAGSVGLHDR
jgi:chromosome segregation ATPase